MKPESNDNLPLPPQAPCTTWPKDLHGILTQKAKGVPWELTGAVRAPYGPLLKFLLDNQESVISAKLPEIVAVMHPPKRAPRSPMPIRDIEGNVVGIFDYYYKAWMPLVGKDAVKFGKKASATSGYNASCLEGQAHLTRRSQAYMREERRVLQGLLDNTLTKEQGEKAMSAARLKKSEIIPTEQKTFVVLDELVSSLVAQGVKVIVPPASDEAGTQLV